MLTHLEELEAESIYVIREFAAQFEKTALLFSGGKDSIVMSHLAYKAFYPQNIPFSFLHVDTGHNFAETIAFRDELAQRLNVKMIVASVQESIDKGRVKEETGIGASRNKLQTVTLVDAIRENKLDALLGGGRRDEEKARAKERFFSHRNAFSQWDPKNQRPELFYLFNGHKDQGEHFRVFPLSNWTELDVWQYIREEKIQVPSLYFSHEREVFERDGMVLAYYPFIKLHEDEKVERKKVRCRTIGDITCTGLTLSEADSVDSIIQEISSSAVTERGSRSDDRRSESAMEERKKAGYF